MSELKKQTKPQRKAELLAPITPGSSPAPTKEQFRAALRQGAAELREMRGVR